MKIFKTPFATQGDRVAVPDEMQADGSVSYTQGYSQDYEKEYDKAGAKDIERSKMNAIFHDITDAIGKGQSTGIYPWIKEAAPYAKGSFVYYNKEAFYSLVDNNSDTPADGAKWRALSKKQDALTFTGSGDVVRKSVTDALDKRVTTAQSSADSALKEAQSKQDKLEFVGSGKVMKENGASPKFNSLQVGEEAVTRLKYAGLNLSSHYSDAFLALKDASVDDGLFYFQQRRWRSDEFTYIEIPNVDGTMLVSRGNTRTDKNGVVHETKSTPINTLNVSDMSQEVVNRDDITVTSGAVFRADDALSTRITAAQSKADSAQSKADSAHSLAASKTTEAWVKSVSIGIDQKWVDVTDSRYIDGVFTNDTNKPIQVLISIHREDTGDMQAAVYVDLVQIAFLKEIGSHSIASAVSFIVPSGSTYKISGIMRSKILRWTELR